MRRSVARSTARGIPATALLALAGTIAACGGSGGGGTATTPTKTSPPAQAETTPAVRLDKKTDTAASARSASAAKVAPDELKAQTAAIERGLKDAGFAPISLGKVGDAKADIAVDRSWVVFVYESDRAAAKFALTLKDVYPDPAKYTMFRIDNRIYLVSMSSALSDADTAKLDKIAAAAEGAITAG